jgi:hypothetical protein
MVPTQIVYHIPLPHGDLTPPESVVFLHIIVTVDGGIAPPPLLQNRTYLFRNIRLLSIRAVVISTVQFVTSLDRLTNERFEVDQGPSFTPSQTGV